MDTKRCFKCGCEKPLAGFYAHRMMRDGHLNKCIECTKRDVMEHRQRNLDSIRAYDSERAKLPARVAKKLDVTRKYRASFPERCRANSAVHRSLRAGQMQKWPCEVCGSERSLAHHPHYESPLLVTWLCQPHHKAAHALTDKS